MRLGILIFVSCGMAFGQAAAPFTYLRGVPTTNGTPSVAKLCYRGLTGTSEICLSPDSGATLLNTPSLSVGGALAATGGITSTSTGDAFITAAGSGLAGSANLLLSGAAGANCWNLKANGSGSGLVFGYTSSCTGAYSLTSEITATSSGVTFAQPITVPSCTGCGSGGVTSFNTRIGAVTLTSTDVSNAGGNGSFAVTSASDASLTATASSFATASLLLHGNANANCWDEGAGVGSGLVLKYASSCSGGYSPIAEVTYTPSSVTFAQPITVPSCTGCGSGGVASVTASSPLSSSGGANPNITCSSCLTSAVTSLSGGTGISVSASTGAVSVSFNGSSLPTMTLAATSGFGFAGWNYLTFGSGTWTSGTYYSGTTPGVSCSGAPSGSFTVTGGVVTTC